jgi:hypothetical protein
MPRPTNFVALIRNLVREQVQQAVQGLLGASTSRRKKAANGRRRRRGRRRGPGRPPGSKTRRRGPGRPPKAEQAGLKIRRRRGRPGFRPT